MPHEIKIGQLITNPLQCRDAIHFACAPVVVAEGEMLHPGQHIGFLEGSTTEVCGSAAKPLGIVDPFLKQRVYQGDHIWMLLYPDTIKSLRHEWEHPAFDKPAREPIEAALERKAAQAAQGALSESTAKRIKDIWDAAEAIETTINRMGHEPLASLLEAAKAEAHAEASEALAEVSGALKEAREAAETAKAELAAKEAAEADAALKLAASKIESEAWLRSYACMLKPYLAYTHGPGPRYDQLDIPGGAEDAFQALLDDLRHGEMHGEGSDMHCFSDLDDPEELKRHAENYLGIKINWNDYEYTCSC